MAGDTVARSVSKFIYIRVGGQILPDLSATKQTQTLCTIFIKIVDLEQKNGQNETHQTIRIILTPYRCYCIV
jgi:hypothetical protein